MKLHNAEVLESFHHQNGTGLLNRKLEES